MGLDPGLLLSPRCSLREALEVITKNSRQVALVVEDGGRLVGLVTDGDVRRAILRGITLEARVADVMNTRPTTADTEIRPEDALAVMQRRRIRHLPLVDARGRLVEVVLLEDLLRPAPLPNAAVLMAGGEGSRLHPLTKTVPKPLLRVGGKPLLEIMIERLRASGVHDVHVAVRYKSEMIEEHLGDGSRLGVSIRYVRESEPLGTAGSLTLIAAPLVEPFFLINADILTRCDFRAMLVFHERSGADLTVGMVPHAIDVPYGVLEVRDGHVAGISEKPRLDFVINSGIYVVEPRVIALIPRGECFDAPDLVPLLTAAGRPVAAYAIKEYWLDVGRLNDFRQATRDVAEGLLD